MGLFVHLPAQSVDDLDAVLGTADWTAPKLHLFTNDFTPSLETILADFTEATYTGYAAQTLTWGGAYVDGNGIAVAPAGEKIFTQTAAPNEIVYGGYVTNTAGTKLLASARLDSPFPFEGASTLAVTLKMGLENGLLDTSEVP